MTSRHLFALAVAASLAAPATVATPAERDRDAAPARLVAPTAQQVVAGTPARLVASAVVDFTELSRREAAARAAGLPRPPVRPLLRDQDQNEGTQPEAEGGLPSLAPSGFVPPQINLASPPPTNSFQGLDDIPMADSAFIIIPPDVGGAVGPTKVMCTFNNNYRIQDKVTGAVLSTVGTATFWSPIEPASNLLDLTDPRTTYDPFNNRWIAVMQTVVSNGDILVAVSQTSDPSGGWFEYRFNGFAANYLIDFPILGFNKNWIAVTINRYTSAGAFSRGICLAVDYPQARAGTGSATLFTQGANSHFCTAPSVTLSASEDTLFLVTHLSSTSATVEVDHITGTSAAPTYTSGAAYTRPGGGWAQPGGSQLPQSAPVAGTSACSPPCLIETQDAQVRSAPMYRVDSTSGKGFLYYAQTIGLPASGLTHTAVQWTKLTPGISAGSPTSANAQFADGGRIEDPTATAINGGKWYAFTHVAVNALGDMMVGYSQFSSALHPSAGYSYHDHADPAGTMRDPFVYKAGEDYYHKDFGSGRNRWGDFSTVQVDPTDDLTLWSLQEYAKARVNTTDDATGGNGSRWSSYWAALTTVTQFAINASAGPGGTITPSGTVNVAQGGSQTFNIAANPCFAIADVVVDGVSQGAISSFTFTNVQGPHNISASFAALGPFTIAASAGPNGSISPPGNTAVACGGSQPYSITPAANYHVADVLVDGVSQGVIPSFTFTNVQAPHTISASFAITTHVITASASAGGAIAPNGPTPVNAGTDATFTMTPNSGFFQSSLVVDGTPIAPAPSYTFTNVQADHSIAAGFSSDVSLIALPPTAPTLGPNNACDVIPVTLSRNGSTPVLSYSVTFRLSAGLALCPGPSGVAPGPFLNGVGPTFFNLTDHGGGVYTVDSGLNSNCGATANVGVLFMIGVTSAATSTPDTIAIEAASLQDCSSAALPAVAGGPALVPVDNLPPAVSVTAPNGGETLVAGNPFSINWSASDLSGVTGVDLLLSRTGVAGVYDTVATALPNTPPYAWTVTGPATSDAWLKVVAFDGLGNAGEATSAAAFTISDLTGVEGQPLPVAFALLPVAPNPAQRSCVIRYELPRAARVRLSVIDVRGREVISLANASLGAGRYATTWDGRAAAGPAGAGVYFVRFETPGRTFVRRFALVR